MITTHVHTRDEPVEFAHSNLSESVTVDILVRDHSIILFFAKNEDGKKHLLNLHRAVTQAVAMAQTEEE